MTDCTGSWAGRVTVVDAIMGTGKTNWMIDEMRQRHGAALFSDNVEPPRFLYIATTLDEVERIKTACPEMAFVDPIPEGGRKLTSLNNLLSEGRNIVSTHALFQRIDRDTYEALQHHRYVLVIDEVLQCVSQHPLKKDDKRSLFDHGMVYVDGKGRLRWNHQSWPDYTGRFEDIRHLCDNGNLAWHRGEFLIWELPIDMLRLFEETYILTYLFRGSLMRSYFDLHHVPYEVVSVDKAKGELVSADQVNEAEIKARLRKLIKLMDDPRLNEVVRPHGREQPLSSSWFDRQGGKTLKALKLSTENFFRHYAATPSNQNMWTTYKAVKPRLKGKGYSRGFVPVNCKATNDYIEKSSLAYLANIFVHPIEAGYFQDHRVEVDNDAFALSEMLQWIWRSQVRRGDPIVVFIPSERMRDLFKDWLYADAQAVPVSPEEPMELEAA